MSARPPRYLSEYRDFQRKTNEVALIRLSQPFVHAAFDEDAVRVADACAVPTFTRVINGERVPAVYVNSAAIVSVIAALEEAGYKAAVLGE